MPWNPTVVDSQILAIHAALVPNGDDGEVVLFGGDEHWSAQQNRAATFARRASTTSGRTLSWARRSPRPTATCFAPLTRSPPTDGC